MNIVIPMAGSGSRFIDAGYTIPKPFLPLGGKTMIEQVIYNVSRAGDTVFLIYRAEHWSYVKELKKIIVSRKIEAILDTDPGKGAALAVLLARS